MTKVRVEKVGNQKFVHCSFWTPQPKGFFFQWHRQQVFLLICRWLPSAVFGDLPPVGFWCFAVVAPGWTLVRCLLCRQFFPTLTPVAVDIFLRFVAGLPSAKKT